MRSQLVVAAAVLACVAVVVTADEPATPGTRIVSTNYDTPAPAGTVAVATPPSTRSPQIVTSLNELHAMRNPAQPAKYPPLPYPNNDEHAFNAQMRRLQKTIEDHAGNLKALDEQLQEAKERREQLLHAQRLLHSMVTLHQSELVLKQVDKHIEDLKAKIKKLGADAEEAMRNRGEMKKQLEEEMAAKTKELEELRAKLKQHQEMLSNLGAKREEVAQTVSEWRGFVDRLRSDAGLPGRSDSLSIPALPRPPQSEEEEEEQQAEGAAASAKSAGSGEDSEEPAERKAPMESVEAPPLAALGGITAKDHEIAATHNSIQELLNVHLPRIAGWSFKGKRSGNLRHNRHAA